MTTTGASGMGRCNRRQWGSVIVAEQFPLLTRDQIGARSLPGKRSLLFVHGIFSSAEGGFGDILQNGSLTASLRQRYADRIYAWDHFTVSKGTVLNAQEMLHALPPQLNLDIICHSRGAVVTRAALELEDATTRALRATALASLGKVLFVAGAHQGSALARRANLDRLLNAFSLMGSVAGGVVLPIVIGVLKVLAHGVADLPGIEDLDPDRSTVLPLINTVGMSPAQEYLAVRANFDYAKPFAQRLLNFGADAVFGAPNDLVVPFDGAFGWDNPLGQGTVPFRSSYGSDATGQNFVWHTNFFSDVGMVGLIKNKFGG